MEHATMAVSDILKGVTASLDIHEIDWEAIIAAKISHDHFDELCDTIMREGFCVPITLMVNEEDEFGDVTYMLGNGHHRLCAAILLGLDRIPVVISEDDPRCWEESHDGNWEPGESSYDYWHMWNESIGYAYAGDIHNKAYRLQFTMCSDCGEDREYCNCNDPVCNDCHEYECNCTCGDTPNGAWHPDYILNDAYAENVEREAHRVRVEMYRWEWECAVTRMREMCKGSDGCSYSDIAIHLQSRVIAEKWDAWQRIARWQGVSR